MGKCDAGADAGRGRAGEMSDRLRVGRKVGRTIYRQLGPEPSDEDPLIGVMDTVEDAIRVVAAARILDEVHRTLRLECAEVDANDWPDDLHPGDVIEKHLVRAYRAMLEARPLPGEGGPG